MSQLRVLCPACDAVIRVPDTEADRDSVECHRCGEEIPLPVSRASRRGPWMAWALLGVGAVFAGTMITLLVLESGGRQEIVGDRHEGGIEVPRQDEREEAGGVAGHADIAAGLQGNNQLLIADGGAAELRYQWQPGRRYVYQFTIEAGGARPERLTGECRYQLNPNGVVDDEIAEGTGSGTAFVVHGGGYLVTCAHCVTGAVKVEVKLGERTYPGTVVALDKAHDLAVIHIPATDLPALPLADSDQVELAQEVRAVGFPLSDVLGDNVKITRGSISGINRRHGSTVFQIDASIEPGNSGGPLVNERGEVVAVNSAKLTGEDVSVVGFSVPSNYVKRLLTLKNIRVEPSEADETLEGPELARRVTPAVALVTVTTGPGGVGGTEKTILDFSGSYGSGGVRHGVADVTVVTDEFGEVREVSSDESLPYLLGPIARFVIEPLSPSGQLEWEQRSRVQITRTEHSGGPFGGMDIGPPIPRPPIGPRFGPRFGPPGFGGGSPKTTTHEATEIVTYTARSAAPHVYEIVRNYELKSDEAIGGKPLIHIVGEGTIEFDTELGVPIRYEGTATVNRNYDGQFESTPLTVSYRLD